MKLTKKLKAELLKVYHIYWEAYLSGDMKTFASMLDDNIKVFGTAVSEVFNSKTETVRFYKATADQMTGKAEFRNRKIMMHTVDETVLIHEQNDLYVLIENEWNFYGPARVSALLVKTPKGWKLAHQHGSFPDSRAEAGEQIAPEKIKKENLELREAIKRRTVELVEINRELEIETSLEKVRAVAMGMKKPEDMLAICKIISQQLQKLGVKDIRNVQTAIFYESRGTYMNYEYYAKHDKTIITDVDFKNHKIQLAFAKKMMKGENEEVREHLKGKKLHDWYAYQKTTNQFADKYLLKAESLNYYWYSLGPVALGVSTYKPLLENETILFKRFLKVFELAYRRYLDIEKAELQAREAKIEVALERVRSKAMAMHSSDELKALIGTVFSELIKLDLALTRCIIWVFEPATNAARWWMANREDSSNPMNFFIKYHEHPAYLRFVYEWKNQNVKFVYDLKGKDKIAWDNILFNETELKHLPKVVKSGMRAPDRVLLSASFNNFGGINVASLEPLSEEHFDILLRFAKVFDLTYTRFLDLKKAEAQAREAQIEAALERVRAHAMGLRKSSELQNIITIIFEELNKLGISLSESSIFIKQSETHDLTCWTSTESAQLVESYNIPYFNHPIMESLWADLENNVSYREFIIERKELLTFCNLLFTLTDFKNAPDEYKNSLSSLDKIYVAQAMMNHGYLEVFGTKPLPEKFTEVLRRFTNVIDLTYTRFLDLQKSEAQAREAEIELALERVRAKTMAMQKSDDLAEAAKLLFQQVRSLGIESYSSGFTIWENNDRTLVSWMCNADGSINPPFRMPASDIEWHKQQYDSWRNKEDYIVHDFSANEMRQHYAYLRSFPLLNDAFNKSEIAGVATPERQVHHAFNFSHGNLLFITLQPVPHAYDIFKRFAKVFDQTYTRFLDLQKAEAQAREAEIQLALERVRARSLAMQQTSELQEVVNEVAQQLMQMKIDMDGGVTIIINDEVGKDLPMWGAAGAANYVQEATVPYLDIPIISRMKSAIKKRVSFLIERYTKEEKDEFMQHLFRHHPWDKLSHERKQELLSREGGYCRSISISRNTSIAIINHHGREFSEADNNILKRFGNVLEQSYTRFLDLQRAEAQYKIIQIENERKTRELEEARELQLAMLPKEIPHLKDFEIAVYMKTATEVGGDYYDFSFMNNGSLNIAIGDATGHGMKAGTMVTMIKSLFTANSGAEEITSFFSSTNEAIKNSNLKRMMIAFAMVNIYGNRLKVINAAMPPVYYYKNGERKILELGGHNLPLGAMNKSKYTTDEIELKRGDVILMLSDGFPELQNHIKEQYGYERLVNTFLQVGNGSAEEILNTFKDESYRWANGKELDDDISFVVVKLKKE